MKVERKTGFEPIRITIETEAEAIELWHRLNIGSFEIKRYCGGKFESDSELSYKMFVSLDDVFEPNDIEEK